MNRRRQHWRRITAFLSVAVAASAAGWLWTRVADVSVPSGASTRAAGTRTAAVASREHAADTDDEARRVAPESPPTASDAAEAVGSLHVNVWFGGGNTREAAPRIGVELVYRHDLDNPFGRRRAVTSDRGEVRFDGLPPGDAYVRTDRAVLGPKVRVVANTTTRVDVELVQCLDASGVVVDPFGLPVRDAVVEVVPLELDAAAVRMTTTDRDGRFVIRALPPHCALGARAQGYGESELHAIRAGPGANVDVRIPLTAEGGELRCLVVDPTGAPVSDAIVQVGLGEQSFQNVTVAGGGLGYPRGPVRGVTDAEGRLQLFGLPPGDIAVGARARDLSPWIGRSTIAPHGATDLRIQLRVGGACEGTITADEGRPVRNAIVMARHSTPFLTVVTSSRVDGIFRLGGLLAGDVRIEATAPRGKATTRIAVTDGVTVRWDPKLVRQPRLRGRVVTESGTGVGDAQILVAAPTPTEAGEPWQHALNTGGDGSFVVPDCPIGQLIEVHVFAAGEEIGAAAAVDPTRGDVVITVADRAAPTARIAGTLIDRSGRPITHGEIQVRAFASGLAEVHTPDSTTGALSIKALKPGKYQVLIRVPGLAPCAFVQDVAADSTWDLGKIVLVPGGRIRVTVQRSVAGEAQAILRVLDARGAPVCSIDASAPEGVSEPLLPGLYRVEIGGEGIAAYEITCQVRDEQETPVSVALRPGVVCILRCFLSEAFATSSVRLVVESNYGAHLDRVLPAVGGTVRAVGCSLAPGSYSAFFRSDGASASHGVDFDVVQAPEGSPPTSINLKLR